MTTVISGRRAGSVARAGGPKRSKTGCDRQPVASMMGTMSIRADPHGAAVLIAQAYATGPPSGIAEVARGAMGRVWRLSTDAAAYAVKELFWVSPGELDSAENEIRREVAFRESAMVTGITAPVDLRTVDGRYLWVLPADPDRAVVRVATWADGVPPTVDTPGRADWIGRTLGRLHALDASADGWTVDPWSTTPPAAGRWSELADQATSAGMTWADSLRDRIPYFLELTTHVPKVDPANLRLAHTDLQPQNVLVDHRGRFTLLDWQVEPQDPASGLAAVLVDWHVHDGSLDEEGVRTTLAGYRAAGGSARMTDLTAFGFAGYLNYVAGQVAVALDDTGPDEHRSHAREVVTRQLAAAPLPPRVYERILRLARTT